MLAIVLAADPSDGVADHPADLGTGKADWPADPGVLGGVLAQGYRANAGVHVGLEQDVWLAAVGRGAEGITDAERGMRPRRLGQVLDGDADPGVALDQEHVALAEHGGERIGI